jgi:hypothetical protein
MAGCGCGSGRARARSGPTRTLYQVVLDGESHRVAFQTHDPAAAKSVARNYPGSRVEPDPDAVAEDAQAPVDGTVSGTEPVEAGASS